MKKNSFKISIILIIVVFTTFMNYFSYKQYYNQKIMNVIQVVIENNPQIDEDEIIGLLKDQNSLHNFDLEKYGYSTNDLFFTNQAKEKLYLNMIFNILITTSIIIIIYYFNYKKNKKRNQEINELIDVIDEINNGNYDFNLSKYNESEFSKLYNTVFNTTILLKEHNKYLYQDRIILKDNLADVSHQLKTPLTTSSLLLESLLEDDLSIEKQNQFIKKIYDKNEKICSLIEILLKLSKLDTSTIQFKKQDVEIYHLLHKIKVDVQELLNQKNITMHLNIPKDIIISCDQNWQEEALVNIVKNCIEFSKQDGIIDVDVEDNNFYTMIKIKDHGKGIKESEIHKIFERFHKSQDSTGVGIGLNLAKTIIEKDGGIISVKSKVNEYTQFSIKYLKSL